MSRYASQWNRFRRWSRFGLVAFLSTLLSVAAIVYLSSRDAAVFYLATALLMAVLSAALVAFFLFKQARFPCPKCGNPFTQRNWWSGSPHRNHCASCGLGLFG